MEVWEQRKAAAADYLGRLPDATRREIETLVGYHFFRRFYGNSYNKFRFELGLPEHPASAPPPHRIPDSERQLRRQALIEYVMRNPGT